jgi:UrcA family protein
MSKLVSRIAAIATLALAATPIIGLSAAHAASRAAPIARVQIGDLTLSQPEGAREFQRRADHAAEQACSARKVRGLSYRACLMDIAADLREEMTPAQRSALMTGQKARPASFAAN